MPSTDSALPIFHLYTIEELSQRLGYKKSTLVQLEDGYAEPTDRFKFTAAAILNRSIVDLFGPQEPAP